MSIIIGVALWLRASGKNDQQPEPEVAQEASKRIAGIAALPLSVTASPLLKAAKVAPRCGFPREDFKTFKQALDGEKDVDASRDEQGRTALHWAARYGNANFAALLILRGADVNAVDNRGYTPLLCAVEANASFLQKELVLAGANLDWVAKDQKSALTLAIERGEADVVVALLRRGAKLRLPEVEERMQPISIAKRRGNPKVLDAIANHEKRVTGITPELSGEATENALHQAAKTGDFERVDALLASGVAIDTPDKNGLTPLHYAVVAPQEEMVSYLLIRGANPNLADAKGRTPLMRTMGWFGSSFDSIRRSLILKKANPLAVRSDGYNELTWAAERDNDHGVQWLLWLGADGRELTPRGTPFQVAFQAGRQGIMDLLRRNGIDEPIVLSDDPVWNLHNAVRRGDETLLKEMLAQGVPVDAPDKVGDSPLMVAIATRNVNIANQIVDLGADIHFQNKRSGVSPIYMTMIWDYGSMETFRKRLFDAGVNLNVQNAKGETPLMRGIWKTPNTPLRQLVEMGADLNIRDQSGKTALTRAIDAGHHETVEYLRKAGATE